MNVKDKRSSYRLHICITIAVMLFIFVHSAMPGHISGAESNIIVQFIAGITGWNEEILRVVVRKAAHFTEFLVLGICLSVNMRDLREKNISDGTAAADAPAAAYRFAAWFIGTVYAMTDEFHQLFVQDRVCSVTDMCIDSAGVVCGVLIYCAFMRSASKRTRKTRS